MRFWEFRANTGLLTFVDIEKFSNAQGLLRNVEIEKIFHSASHHPRPGASGPGRSMP